MYTSTILKNVFDSLLAYYGPQHWWPADTPFEVMVGAILTQNTAWTNVEKAIGGLREITDLSPDGILILPEAQLAKAIRPSGYFNQKAQRLKVFCRFLEKHDGNIDKMRSLPIQELRKQLLNLHGIGPETADSILLYALGKPVFVVDAYTTRLCSRLGLTDGNESYDQVQAVFMENLNPDVKTYNEFHALIVQHGKTTCRKKSPLCKTCALLELCVYGKAVARG